MSVGTAITELPREYTGVPIEDFRVAIVYCVETNAPVLKVTVIHGNSGNIFYVDDVKLAKRLGAAIELSGFDKSLLQ